MRPQITLLTTLALGCALAMLSEACSGGNAGTSLNLTGTWRGTEAVAVLVSDTSCTGTRSNPLGSQDTFLHLTEGAASGASVSYSGTWVNHFSLSLPVSNATLFGSTAFDFDVANGWCGQATLPANPPASKVSLICQLTAGSSTMLCTYRGTACLKCTQGSQNGQYILATINTSASISTAQFIQQNH